MAPLPIQPQIDPDVSVVLPCLNEAGTVGSCARKALACLARLGAAGEVVVADNGSADGSRQAAEAAGARVVPVAARGYGHALLGGIAAARAEFVVMADADDSYALDDLGPFLDKLDQGYDLVVGNRFAGGVRPGAMPWLHRLGNPLLSGVGRLLFPGTPCRDFHCGLRAFRKSAIDALNLSCGGMEFATEMVAKAALARLRVAEVPTVLSPDGRGGRPGHLRAWRDGWRHLRLMLALRLARRPRHARRAGAAGARALAPAPAALPIRPAGFTLVELLVVIGIIVVLTAIVVPSASRAYAEANRVACLSNLRQLAHAYAMYTGENKGKGMGFTFSTERSWVEAFREYCRTGPAAASPAGLNGKVHLCPEADEANEDFGSASRGWTLELKPPTGQDGGGSPTPAPSGAVAGPRRITGSYGFNGWLMRWDPAGKGGEAFSGGPRERYVTSATGEASRVPLFADATWADGWPRADDPAPPDLSGGDRGRQGVGKAPKENMLARFTIARHGRAVNAAFLDGHGERVPLERLKRLKWHDGFIYREWDPRLPGS